MIERQLKIMESLIYSASPRAVEELMSDWRVSERTIKYDLSQIRSELKGIDISLLNKKGVGYYFSPVDKPKLIDHYSLAEVEDFFVEKGLRIEETTVVFWNHIITLLDRIDESSQNDFDLSEVDPMSKIAHELTLEFESYIGKKRTFSLTNFERYLLAIYFEQLIEGEINHE